MSACVKTTAIVNAVYVYASSRKTSKKSCIGPDSTSPDLSKQMVSNHRRFRQRDTEAYYVDVFRTCSRLKYRLQHQVNDVESTRRGINTIRLRSRWDRFLLKYKRQRSKWLSKIGWKTMTQQVRINIRILNSLRLRMGHQCRSYDQTLESHGFSERQRSV